MVCAACAPITRGAGAQSRSAARAESCNGRFISAISINAERPPFAGSARRWQAVARALGLHHATTRADVVRAYLFFKEGDLCSDVRIAESERVLRGLPFLADARARVHADSASSGVVVEITTTDEIPVLVSGSLRHGAPSALSLGNENVGGNGLRVVIGGQRGDVYRGGAHASVTDFALFDQPIVGQIEGARDPLGGHVELDLSHQLLSDVQHGAFHASFRNGDDFPLILRPEGDDEAIEVHEQRWSVSGILRSDFGPTVALWGPVLLGTGLSPVSRIIVVSDSGAIVTNDSALLDRLTPFHAVRLGGLLGVRRVHYLTRSGLDALFAPQDVMLGWQLGGMVAPGATSNAGRDMLIAHSMYLGAASNNMVLIADAEAEARRDFTSGMWQSTIGNARGAAYIKPSERVLISVQDNFSSLGHARVPTQLSLGDLVGGPRGYVGSTIAGGRRNVTRAEIRWAGPAAIRRSDIGVALFADAAQMWAGDVPYGVSASRQSVGLSILAAYPTKSKRLYRLDFAFPLQRDQGRGLQVRFSNSNPTVNVSVEPSDVTQARLGPIPSSLFAWPGR
jgi:hypothetical protein